MFIKNLLWNTSDGSLYDYTPYFATALVLFFGCLLLWAVRKANFDLAKALMAVFVLVCLLASMLLIDEWWSIKVGGWIAAFGMLTPSVLLPIGLWNLRRNLLSAIPGAVSILTFAAYMAVCYSYPVARMPDRDWDLDVNWHNSNDRWWVISFYLTILSVALQVLAHRFSKRTAQQPANKPAD